MRKVTLMILSTVAVLVLLFSYRTSTGGGQVSSARTAAAGGSTPGAAPDASGGTVLTGPVVDTRWGPVQVQVTVQGGKIVKVVTPQLPSGNNRDRQINDQAVPILVQETIQAQSARIDGVSGATVTSDGYVQSLQAALDKAGG
ncbi:MAG TPA: FMN-binding protein [Pseudonocardiaceae bacterium]|nr:FMN-binding protein [Pseudonocardiaceae bacterium]